MSVAPKWYRELYKEFIKENPTKADENQVKIMEEIDLILATKGPIPAWDSELNSKNLIQIKMQMYKEGFFGDKVPPRTLP